MPYIQHSLWTVLGALLGVDVCGQAQSLSRTTPQAETKTHSAIDPPPLFHGIHAWDVEMEGTIMLDWSVFSAENSFEMVTGDFADGTEVRRAELEMELDLIEGLSLEIEYDFAGLNPNFKDLFLETQHFRAGIFKEPFGLEILTESRYSTFLERGLVQSLTPPRSFGLEVRGGSESGFTWAVGGFSARDTFEGSDEFGDRMLTGRVTKRFSHGDEAFTHLGIAFSQRESDEDDVLRIKQRPEVHRAPVALDTGPFGGDSLRILGLELATIHGPLSFQAEYVQTRIDLLTGSGVRFSGIYGYVSYFLTGEQRQYKEGAGAFGRVSPNRDFEHASGTGAWELAARFSHLDLNDSSLMGEKLDDVTLGVNWYLSSHTRVMANYVHSWLDDAGRASSFAMRIQFDI